MNKLLLKLTCILFISATYVLTSVTGYSQVKQFNKGTVQRITVHGKGLEGNLSGDSPDRYVSVYLPPSYKNNPKKHYPVVYFLHGFTDSDDKWYGFVKHWINLPAILDTTFSANPESEMIFVTPNAYTKFKGSFYSNSITIGNWEDFIAKELVSYMDTHYRTIPQAASRGIAGHSMGGYGAMRIGPKYPGIFGGIYLLSPGVTQLYTPFAAKNMAKMDSIKNMEDFDKADFWTKVLFACSAAWSPDPGKPPFFFDYPSKGNTNELFLQAKWIANSPFAMLDQYISNYKKLLAIGFDSGNKDEYIAAEIKMLHEELTKYGIQHTYEIYDGNHVNRVGLRIKQNMVPFFSGSLSFKRLP